MREASKERKTAETDIRLRLVLDGTGKTEIDTGCGFMDHMLELFAKHGRMDVTIMCKGDTHVDFHHSVEDIGIVLGQAFKEALGDKRGVTRYGSMLLPMDEALLLVSLDLSGRAHLSYDVHGLTPKVGDMDTELVKEFLLAFVRQAECTLHVKQLAGENTHHIIEGVFKALGRALGKAVRIDQTLGGEIPSTKGTL
ncbi:MAG: imidazoleglycerol-phosphate dehydratase HisB [Clostridiales bacterium]|nr:imidazoleglycerol-phosphate dehydratase HisB [Clostridiales bacterium]